MDEADPTLCSRCRAWPAGFISGDAPPPPPPPVEDDAPLDVIVDDETQIADLPHDTIPPPPADVGPESVEGEGPPPLPIADEIAPPEPEGEP